MLKRPFTPGSCFGSFDRRYGPDSHRGNDYGSVHRTGSAAKYVLVGDLTTYPIQTERRLVVLDGWRALSISLVMAAHLLPLGPKAWDVNAAIAALGMAFFFTLSGFLITRLLLTSDVVTFIIRRFFRIVPLAWLAMAIVLPVAGADQGTYAAHFLFYANLPPFWLTSIASYLWSLCVEVQFYVAIAASVALFGRRALHFLPLACISVTALRIYQGAELSIVTWLRVDEILAGGIVALAYEGHIGVRIPSFLKWLNPDWVLPLALASCAHTPLAYLRPYLVSATVGASLFNCPSLLHKLSTNKVTVWIADISYALYVAHGCLMNTWLGFGNTVTKYAKRPLLIGITFAVSYISTKTYERWWIQLGKQLVQRRISTQVRTSQ